MRKQAALPTERPDNGLVLYPNFKDLGLFRIDPFAVPCYVAAEDVMTRLAVCLKRRIAHEINTSFCFWPYGLVNEKAPQWELRGLC